MIAKQIKDYIKYLYSKEFITGDEPIEIHLNGLENSYNVCTRFYISENGFSLGRKNKIEPAKTLNNLKNIIAHFTDDTNVYLTQWANTVKEIDCFYYDYDRKSLVFEHKF